MYHINVSLLHSENTGVCMALPKLQDPKVEWHAVYEHSRCCCNLDFTAPNVEILFVSFIGNLTKTYPI